MTLSLRVYIPGSELQLLLELVADGSTVRRAVVAAELQQQVDRWLATGLRELVEEGGRVRPRVSMPDHPLFLSRLAENIRRQTRLEVRVDEWVEPTVLASLTSEQDEEAPHSARATRLDVPARAKRGKA